MPFKVTPRIYKIYFICSHKLGGNHKVSDVSGDLKLFMCFKLLSLPVRVGGMQGAGTSHRVPTFPVTVWHRF